MIYRMSGSNEHIDWRYYKLSSEWSKSFKKRNRKLIEEGGDISEEFKYEDYVEQTEEFISAPKRILKAIWPSETTRLFDSLQFWSIDCE